MKFKKSLLTIGTISMVVVPTITIVSCSKINDIKSIKAKEVNIAPWWEAKNNSLGLLATNSESFNFIKNDKAWENNEDKAIRNEDDNKIFTSNDIEKNYPIDVFAPKVPIGSGLSFEAFNKKIDLSNYYDQSAKIANMLQKSADGILGWNLNNSTEHNSNNKIVFCLGGPQADRGLNSSYGPLYDNFGQFGDLIAFNESQYGFDPRTNLYKVSDSNTNPYLEKVKTQVGFDQVKLDFENYSLNTEEIVGLLLGDITLLDSEVFAIFSMAASTVDAYRQHMLSLELKKESSEARPFLLGHSYGYVDAMNSVLFNKNFDTDFVSVILESNSLRKTEQSWGSTFAKTYGSSSGGNLAWQKQTPGSDVNILEKTKGVDGISTDGQYSFDNGAFMSPEYQAAHTPKSIGATWEGASVGGSFGIAPFGGVSVGPTTGTITGPGTATITGASVGTVTGPMAGTITGSVSQADESFDEPVTGLISIDLQSLLQFIKEEWGIMGTLEAKFKENPAYLAKVQQKVYFRSHRRDSQIGELYSDEIDFYKDNGLQFKYVQVPVGIDSQDSTYNGHSDFSDWETYRKIFR